MAYPSNYFHIHNNFKAGHLHWHNTCRALCTQGGVTDVYNQINLSERGGTHFKEHLPSGCLLLPVNKPGPSGWESTKGDSHWPTRVLLSRRGERGWNHQTGGQLENLLRPSWTSTKLLRLLTARPIFLVSLEETINDTQLISQALAEFNKNVDLHNTIYKWKLKTTTENT